MKTRNKSVPDEGKSVLAKRIKGLRLKLRLTQEQFAAKVGVTFSTVNRWESARSWPSPLALRRIEELFGENFDEH